MPNVHDVANSADDWWRDTARRALADLAASGREFTAHDLTEAGVPEPDHPNRWGSLFRQANTAGLIVPVGYRPSTRPSRAGGVCRVWRGRTPQERRMAAV